MGCDRPPRIIQKPVGAILTGFFVAQVPDAMTGPRNIQNAVQRQSEGQRTGVVPAGSHSQAAKKAGRPKGAKNKPKGIMPTEMADAILLQMKDMLPEEHFLYLKGVIREGKAISTKTELDTLILLLSRNLYPALIAEQTPGKPEKPVEDFFDDEEDDDDPTQSSAEKVASKIKMPVFRKDVTERLKVLQGLLSLRNQVEKRDSDSKVEEKPVLRIFAGRGIDPGRLRVLVGIESSPVVGDADGVGEPSPEARTVSDQVPERPELLSSGEQGSPDRIQSGDSRRGTLLRVGETELPSKLYIDQPD